MISTLLAIGIFATHFQCLQKIDEGVEYRPVDATVRYYNMNTVQLELFGATAILQCQDGLYTAHVLGDGYEKEYPMVIEYLVSD